MGIMSFFKKNKHGKSEEENKLDRLWKLWAQDQAGHPYGDLMTYQAEVNNGGHHQYFSNVEETGDLSAAMAALESVLSEALQSNLRTAYEAYLKFEEDEDDEEAAETLEQCDEAFYAGEAEVNRKLTEYAAKLEL